MTCDSQHPPAASAPSQTPDLEKALPVFRPRFAAIYSLLAVVACVTIAEVLLKMGATETSAATKDQAVSLGFNALASWHTIVGIAFHIAAFAAWLYTLKSVPLSLAFNFTTIQQVTVILGARIFLYEVVPSLRWAGIALVVIGVLLLVPAIVSAEEKTDREGGPQ